MLKDKKTLFVDIFQILRDDYIIKVRSYSRYTSLYYGTVRDLHMKHSLLKSVICDAEVLNYELRPFGFNNLEAIVDIDITPQALIAEMDENKEIVCDREAEKNTIRYSNYYYGIDPIAHRKTSFCFHDLKIEKVILSGPATIVFWNDGTKTVVKCKDEEEYDPEKGILWAIAKKHSERSTKAYDNYIMFIDGITNHMEYHGIDYPKYPEWFSAKEKEKKKYKRHFGDSSQTCPHCGGNWVWSNKRRMEYYTNGFIDIPCRHCGKTFRICK